LMRKKREIRKETPALKAYARQQPDIESKKEWEKPSCLQKRGNRDIGELRQADQYKKSPVNRGFRHRGAAEERKGRNSKKGGICCPLSIKRLAEVLCKRIAGPILDKGNRG